MQRGIAYYSGGLPVFVPNGDIHFSPDGASCCSSCTDGASCEGGPSDYVTLADCGIIYRKCAGDYFVQDCGGEKSYLPLSLDVESLPVTLGDLGFDFGGLINQAINIGGNYFASQMQAAQMPHANQGIPEADQVALAVYANIDGLIPMIQSGAVSPADAMAAARRFQAVWLTYRGQTRDGRHEYLNQISGAVATKVGLVDKAGADYVAAHSQQVNVVATGAPAASPIASPAASGGFKVTPNMLVYGGGGLVALVVLYLFFRG